VGTAKAALVVAAATLVAARPAHADSCTGGEGSERFATCFDPGNRFSITAATDGFGGAVALRHEIHFEDEPDLVWKMEHDALDTTYDGFSGRFAGMLYRGRYLRHARDGHIVLPLGTPQKVFLPFDIGALVEVGTLRWDATGDATLGMVRTALLVDLSRSRDFRRRLAIGPVASWDLDLTRSPVTIAEHQIAPFSALLTEVHLESLDGLTSCDLRSEAGMMWRTSHGWNKNLVVEAGLERVIIAVNDRPIALYATARYDYARSEALAAIGVRIVLFDKTDPRVQRL
jgi:hypothetical protein